MQFRPFVLTTRGTLGFHARSFIDLVAHQPANRHDVSFKGHIRNQIALARIRSNATLINAALTKHRQYADAHCPHTHRRKLIITRDADTLSDSDRLNTDSDSDNNSNSSVSE